MQVPTNLISLTTRMLRQVRPLIQQNLRTWKEKAEKIPDHELRRQALMSIATKTFHCEGGAIYGLLAKDDYGEAVKFIIAYQTISDYLDNLCDRSSSLDPRDFAALHEAMRNALTPGASSSNYYRYHEEKNDGRYLASLVETCQLVLAKLPNYGIAAEILYRLADYYCDLQVHKHVRIDERIPRLEAWFNDHRASIPEMTWFEFAACCGSTLGIFCIVAQLFNKNSSAELIEKIAKAYFPWVQGLHILLDYLIDQEEDIRGNDLNFCAYYPDREAMLKRLTFIYRQAQTSISKLPNAKFHHLINHGLLSIYLSDPKVTRQKKVRRIALRLLSIGGAKSFFLYLHCWIYRRLT